MRFIQNFKWTDTLQGNTPSAQQDAVFELVSMAFNVALWYTKFASRLAGKENVTEAEAKEVHRSLKSAAGIFKTLKEVHIPRLITPAEKGRDLEPRAMDAYIIQCQAEAQEVTIARAIELKHNATLIAALAFETANFYQKAGRYCSALKCCQLCLLLYFVLVLCKTQFNGESGSVLNLQHCTHVHTVRMFTLYGTTTVLCPSKGPFTCRMSKKRQPCLFIVTSLSEVLGALCLPFTKQPKPACCGGAEVQHRESSHSSLFDPLAECCNVFGRKG